jgi:hypothetical protein
MRNAEALTPANPPAVAPISLPGCVRQDLSCSWEGFSTVVHASIDPADAGDPANIADSAHISAQH